MAANIEKAQEKQKKNYDKRHRGPAIPVGTKVWKKVMLNLHRMGGKMEKRWTGPYIIEAVTANQNYSLRKCGSDKVLANKVPATQLKLYRSRNQHLEIASDSEEEGLYGTTVPAPEEQLTRGTTAGHRRQ